MEKNQIINFNEFSFSMINIRILKINKKINDKLSTCFLFFLHLYLKCKLILLLIFFFIYIFKIFC